MSSLIFFVHNWGDVYDDPEIPSTTKNPDECVDTLGFRDVHSFTCSDWVGIECSNSGPGGYQYTTAQVETVKIECCATCEYNEPQTTRTTSPDTTTAPYPTDSKQKQFLPKVVQLLPSLNLLSSFENKNFQTSKKL